jgi:hypothetical protein
LFRRQPAKLALYVQGKTRGDLRPASHVRGGTRQVADRGEPGGTAGGQERGSIRAEDRHAHIAAMDHGGADRRARRRIPKLSRIVVARREEQLAVGAERSEYSLLFEARRG